MVAESTVKALFDTASDGVVLRVHVQPGAGQQAVVGTHGNALKVRVVAPPASGRANQAVLALLSKELGVPASDLEITSGESARLKRVRLAGLEAPDMERRLSRLLAAPARTPADKVKRPALPRRP